MSDKHSGPSLSLAGPPPDKKRKKSTVSKVKSCAECRRLKLRCDRQVPCDNCERRGTAKICPDGALKTARGRTLILESNAVLHDRIASLEEALKTTTASSGGHPLLGAAYHLGDSDGDSAHDDDGDGELAPRAARFRRPGELEFEHGHGRGRRHDRLHVGEYATDGHGHDDDLPEEERYGHLHIDGNSRSSRFFGDASSLFLVPKSSGEAAQGRGSASDGLYTFRPGWVESFLFERDSALRFEHTLRALVGQLPPREETDRLSEVYFDNVAWGTAVLDKDAYTVDILARFYDGRPPDAQRLAVLFLVLALGSLFDPSMLPGANNNPYSRDWFALGRAALTIDSSGSIIFVQAIHLMVNWLTNGGRVVSSNASTWPLLGMAMRVVQAIGMHRDGTHFDLAPAEVAERRRVFWEINSYDINSAMTSARPRSMTSATLDVEIPRTQDGQDSYHESRYRLSQQIFCKINDVQTSIVPMPYDRVLEIDRELREFQQHLPEQLTMEETSTPKTMSAVRAHNIQRHTMRFQCTIGHLFLHRVWFARALLDEPEEPLRCRYSPSFVGCLEACKLILGVVRRLWDMAPFECQRRWFFLFHSFTACACLAAAVIRAPQSMLTQSSLVALEEGIKLFQEAGKHDELAILLPLRETARRSFAHSGRSRPTTDEDLALLGKAGRRSASAKLSPASTSQHGTPAQPSRPLSASPLSVTSLAPPPTHTQPHPHPQAQPKQQLQHAQMPPVRPVSQPAYSTGSFASPGSMGSAIQRDTAPAMNSAHHAAPAHSSTNRSAALMAAPGPSTHGAPSHAPHALPGAPPHTLGAHGAMPAPSTAVAPAPAPPSAPATAPAYRPLETFDWYNGGHSVSEFDFDAFLASFGIQADVSNVFGDPDDFATGTGADTGANGTGTGTGTGNGKGNGHGNGNGHGGGGSRAGFGGLSGGMSLP
ncbi:hypothetical protein Q5752_000959 [Cryptotrichosporon argae]